MNQIEKQKLYKEAHQLLDRADAILESVIRKCEKKTAQAA